MNGMNQYYQRHTDGQYEILVAGSKKAVIFCKENGYQRINAKEAFANYQDMVVDNQGQDLFGDLLPVSEKRKKHVKRASAWLESVVK